MEDQKGDLLGDGVDEKSMRRFNEIIERIEQVRGYLGLNRSKFCRAIGMSPQTYNNFIGPQGTKPNIQLLHGVVTQFGVNPMWLFTGRGNIFLAGYGDRPGLRPMMSMGTEAIPGYSAPLAADTEEVAGLAPLLRRLEGLLQRMDGQHGPLLNRFTEVFKRYLALHPDAAVAELQGLLETVERRIAQDTAAGG